MGMHDDGETMTVTAPDPADPNAGRENSGGNDGGGQNSMGVAATVMGIPMTLNVVNEKWGLVVRPVPRLPSLTQKCLTSLTRTVAISSARALTGRVGVFASLMTVSAPLNVGEEKYSVMGLPAKELTDMPLGTIASLAQIPTKFNVTAIVAEPEQQPYGVPADVIAAAAMVMGLTTPVDANRPNVSVVAAKNVPNQRDVYSAAIVPGKPEMTFDMRDRRTLKTHEIDSFGSLRTKTKDFTAFISERDKVQVHERIVTFPADSGHQPIYVAATKNLNNIDRKARIEQRYLADRDAAKREFDAAEAALNATPKVESIALYTAQRTAKQKEISFNVVELAYSQAMLDRLNISFSYGHHALMNNHKNISREINVVRSQISVKQQVLTQNQQAFNEISLQLDLFSSYGSRGIVAHNEVKQAQQHLASENARKQALLSQLAEKRSQFYFAVKEEIRLRNAVRSPPNMPFAQQKIYHDGIRHAWEQQKKRLQSLSADIDNINRQISAQDINVAGAVARVGQKQQAFEAVKAEVERTKSILNALNAQKQRAKTALSSPEAYGFDGKKLRVQISASGLGLVPLSVISADAANEAMDSLSHKKDYFSELTGVSGLNIALSIPLSASPADLSGKSISLPVRGVLKAGGISAALTLYDVDKHALPSQVPVLHAGLDNSTGLYKVVLPVPFGSVLISPANPPKPDGLPVGVPVPVAIVPAHTGTTADIVELPSSTVYPMPEDVDFNDFILVFPADSGVKPVYIMLSSPRDKPGVASGIGGEITGVWLSDAGKGIGVPIPRQIADKLRGRQFASFDRLREAIWEEASKDPILASQFKRQNFGLISKGYSPYTVSSEQVGKRKKYELHHVVPVSEGGDIYNIDNLRAVTPKKHIKIHSEKVEK